MITFSGLPSDIASHLRHGKPDAHGQPAEHAISDGAGNPCRHCLAMIEKDAPFLIASHRPFSTRQPYAEQGPIFLHAEACLAYEEDGTLPTAYDSAQYLLRGYDAGERIVYGSGAIVARHSIREHAALLLESPAISFVHVRSATNNCWQGRIERA